MDLTLKVLNLLYKCFIAFGLVFTMTFCFVIYTNLSNLNTLQKSWIKTQAEIANISLHERYSGPQAGTQYETVFVYLVENQRFEKRNITSVAPGLKQGEKVDILVNPVEPSRAVLSVKDQIGLFRIYLGLGVFVSLVLIIILVPKRYFGLEKTDQEKTVKTAPPVLSEKDTES